EVGAGPLRQLETAVGQVGDGDVAGTHVPGDGSSHDADRARAGDDDVLTRERDGRGGVDGIAEGSEDGAEVRVDVLGVHPRVRGGDDDDVGEGAVTVDPDPDGVDAQVATAGAAVAAGTAHEVALAGDPVTDRRARHHRTDLDDL